MEKQFPQNTGNDEIDPQLIKRNSAVYGDTDLNPNQDDQEDEHHADADEVV